MRRVAVAALVGSILALGFAGGEAFAGKKKQRAAAPPATGRTVAGPGVAELAPDEHRIVWAPTDQLICLSGVANRGNVEVLEIVGFPWPFYGGRCWRNHQLDLWCDDVEPCSVSWRVDRAGAPSGVLPPTPIRRKKSATALPVTGRTIGGPGVVSIPGGGTVPDHWSGVSGILHCVTLLNTSRRSWIIASDLPKLPRGVAHTVCGTGPAFRNLTCPDPRGCSAAWRVDRVF